MSMPSALRRIVLMLALIGGPVGSASAQETVTIGLPGAVSFAVGTATSVAGLPDPTTVNFSDATLTPGRVLRFSVMATASTFSGPGGSSYPPSAVSWTVSSASGGSGSNGTLTASGYTQVFQSDTLTASGSFDIRWTLTPADGADYAGVHTLTLRWKVESVQP